jgi:hypothetical protein
MKKEKPLKKFRIKDDTFSIEQRITIIENDIKHWKQVLKK